MADPWAPFESKEEFNLIKFFLDTNMPDTQINQFFNSGLIISPALVKTTSAETMKNRLELMDPMMPHCDIRYFTHSSASLT